MKRILAFGLAGLFLFGAAMVATAQAPSTPAAEDSKAPGERAQRLKERFDSLPPEVKEALPERLKQRIAKGFKGPEGRPGKDFTILHADGVAMKRDGAKVGVRIQKGVIQAVSATSITLKSADGYTQTYVINDQTKVRGKGRPSAASDLKPEEMAKVLATKEGNGYVARTVNSVGEPGPRLKQGPDKV